MGKRSLSGTTKAFLLAAGLGITGAAVYVYGSIPHEDENGNLREPFFGSSTQKTGSVSRDVGNITYTIEDGLVIEDIPDDDYRALDRYVYDFNNRLLHIDYRVTSAGGNVKDFNELKDENGNLPPNFDFVRSIACEIAQEYFDRAESPKYDDPPIDIVMFQERHCSVEMK